MTGDMVSDVIAVTLMAVTLVLAVTWLVLVELRRRK
jgi:hypothetical protein